MELGRLIAKARKEHDLTQFALAEMIGVSAEAISKWEKGVYQPSPENMELLEDALHLSYYDDAGDLRSGRIFDEDHMSAFLKGKFASGQFPEAQKRCLSPRKSTKRPNLAKDPEMCRI